MKCAKRGRSVTVREALRSNPNKQHRQQSSLYLLYSDSIRAHAEVKSAKLNTRCLLPKPTLRNSPRETQALGLTASCHKRVRELGSRSSR